MVTDWVPDLVENWTSHLAVVPAKANEAIESSISKSFILRNTFHEDLVIYDLPVATSP